MFKSLPSIYQIDICSECNLSCPMCLRTALKMDGNRMPVALLQMMLRRGDFDGTHYTELQQAGEPTLHPELEVFLLMLKEAGVKVGLSTNGLLMRKRPYPNQARTVAHILCELADTLTISIDSVNPTVYAEMRAPAKFSWFEDELTHFVEVWRSGSRRLMVDLQVLRIPDLYGSGNIDAVRDYLAQKGWTDVFHVRGMSDTFIEMSERREPGIVYRPEVFCLNPWTSISVTSRGHVVSCCYVFAPQEKSINVYGNLWENSLREIWNSPTVDRMRSYQIACAAGLPFHDDSVHEGRNLCRLCYEKNPEFLHEEMLCRLSRRMSSQS